MIAETPLSDELRDILLDVCLSEVCDILARASRTEFEEALLMGLVTFGRAALTPDLREKMIWYCAGLESILLRDSSEPILHNLSEPYASRHHSISGRFPTLIPSCAKTRPF